MPTRDSIVADNLQRVQDRIAQAAQRVRRDAKEVTLVGVTKYVSADLAAVLFRAGCKDLGESRPQELWDKADCCGVADVRWHLVGHLQRNKVRRTLPLVKLIHSVDSQRLLQAIDNEAAQTGRADVLLEVNTSGDSAKHGVRPDLLAALLEAASKLSYVNVRGLMTMAALDGGELVARQNFAALRETRNRFARDAPDGIQLDVLSMGMSGDFEAAVQEGATIVRIGSLLWEGVEHRGAL